jgi:hypothetical protein
MRSNRTLFCNCLIESPGRLSTQALGMSTQDEIDTMMISTEQPETTETPIQWAVTSTLALTTALVQDIDDAVIFDDLKEAFEAARDGTTGGGTLMVWGLHGPRDVIAIAHNGQLFFECSDPSEVWTHNGQLFFECSGPSEVLTGSEPEPSPTNPLRSAFPWTVNPCEDFSVEPGLSKREWMAATVAAGFLGRADFSVRASAIDAVDMADELLQRLGPTGTDEF